MIYIKAYENYNINKETLYVFDFDDTLVETESFEKFVIDYLNENVIEDIINNSIDSIGVTKSDLKWQDNRVYVNDPNREINIKGNWVRKGNRVYLVAPDEFGATELSLPTKVLDLIDFYNQVENKCIVTARPESIRQGIEKAMKKLGIGYPKYGLYMYPHIKHREVGKWKGQQIIDISKKYNFNKVIFYDDNIKYIKGAKNIIKQKCPEMDFSYVKV
jgi:hypothetical protein